MIYKNNKQQYPKFNFKDFITLNIFIPLLVFIMLVNIFKVYLSRQCDSLNLFFENNFFRAESSISKWLVVLSPGLMTLSMYILYLVIENITKLILPKLKKDCRMKLYRMIFFKKYEYFLNMPKSTILENYSSAIDAAEKILEEGVDLFLLLTECVFYFFINIITILSIYNVKINANRNEFNWFSPIIIIFFYNMLILFSSLKIKNSLSYMNKLNSQSIKKKNDLFVLFSDQLSNMSLINMENIQLSEQKRMASQIKKLHKLDSKITNSHISLALQCFFLNIVTLFFVFIIGNSSLKNLMRILGHKLNDNFFQPNLVKKLIIDSKLHQDFAKKLIQILINLFAFLDRILQTADTSSRLSQHINELYNSLESLELNKYGKKIIYKKVLDKKDNFKINIKLDEERIICSNCTFIPDITNTKIEFKDVNFKFKPNLNYVFNNFNLILEDKSKTAIIGSSGSGKTTLVKLLTGILKLTSGDIIIGDKYNIRDTKSCCWSKLINYIPQEPLFFDRNFIENILLSEEDLINYYHSNKDFIDIMKKVNMLDFFAYLNSENNLMIGQGGSRLSGGQKQRLSIARILRQNKPVCIEDEATSALDFQNEKILVQSINDFVYDKTLLSIVHKKTRLKSIKKTIVLSDCQIVEYGFTEDLLNDINSITYGLFSN